MSYATLDEMLTRFGETRLADISDVDGGAELKPAVIQAALDDASELINAYAAGRYTVPLSPVPAPVRRWCADMAIYNLHLSKSGNMQDEIRKAFEDAMKGLADMQKGVVVFQAEGIPSPEKPVGGSVAVAGPPRMFTGNTLQGF